MPRRPRPVDPNAVGAALSPALRSALAELTLMLGIAPGGWQATPLGALFTTAAAVRLAARIGREHGATPADALRRACGDLGVPPATVRNRLDRWQRDSNLYKRSEPFEPDSGDATIRGTTDEGASPHDPQRSPQRG